MQDIFNMDSMIWGDESKKSSPLVNSMDDPVYANFINTLSGTTPSISTESDEATPFQNEYKVDQGLIDFISAPIIEQTIIKETEDEKSKNLSFLTKNESIRKQYVETAANLEAMKKYNPEQYTEFKDTFNDRFLEQFDEKAVPKNTMDLFKKIKEVYGGTDVIATANGYGTLFTILMESQLKTKDQITNQKSDFYYLTNDKDFRDRVMESVKDEFTRKELQKVFDTLDKDNDETVSTVSKIFNNPHDKDTFNKAVVQNMVPYLSESVRLLTKGKSIASLATGAVGATGLAAKALGGVVGIVVSGAMMAAMGTFFQSEEEKKTKGQSEILDMIIKVKSGEYTQKQIDAAVAHKVKAEYIDPVTGMLLKDKLDEDVKAGIETSLTTPWLTPNSIHEYNLSGGVVAQPRRNFDYSGVESLGDLTGEAIGSFAVLGLKAMKGGLRPFYRGSSDVGVMVGAFAMNYYHSVKQNYIFDVLQGFTVPVIMQNETLAKIADYNFLTRPIIYQALNVVPHFISHKLAGVTFGDLANMSKATQSHLADGAEEFNKIFNMQLKFAKGINDNLNTTSKDLIGIHEKIIEAGTKGVKLDYSDLNDFIKLGGMDAVLNYNKIVDSGGERLRQIEDSRSLRTIGYETIVKDLTADDNKFFKTLLGIGESLKVENSEVYKGILALAADMGDNTRYTGKTNPDGTSEVVKIADLVVKATNNDGKEVDIPISKELSVGDLKTILTTYFSNDTTEDAIKDKITKLESYSDNFSKLRSGVNLDEATAFFSKQGFDSDQINKLRLGDFTKESIEAFSGVIPDADITAIKTLLVANYAMASPKRAKDGVVSKIRQSIYNILKFNGSLTEDPAHKISTSINLALNTIQIFENGTKLNDSINNTKSANNVYRNVFNILNNALNIIDEFRNERLSSAEDSTILFKDQVDSFNKLREEFQKMNPDNVTEKDIVYLKNMIETFKNLTPMVKHDFLLDYQNMLSDIAKLSAIVKNPEKAQSTLQPGEEDSIIENLFINKDYDTEVKPIIDDFTNNGASSILRTLSRMKGTSVGTDPNIMSKFSIFKALGWEDNKTVNEAIDALHTQYTTLKEKFPEMFENGEVNLAKLQEKLNGAVSLQDFTNKINMQLQARGYISVNPKASAASILTNLYKVMADTAEHAKNVKEGKDNAEVIDRLGKRLREVPYIHLLKNNGVNASAGFASSLLNSIPNEIKTGSLSFIFNRFRGMTEAQTQNPIYKLLQSGIGGSYKEAAMLLGVDNLVSDNIHKGVLRALGVYIDFDKPVTKEHIAKASAGFIKILNKHTQKTPIANNLHNEESRKTFYDTVSALSKSIDLEAAGILIETSKSAEGKYVDYTKAYQELITALGSNIKDAIVHGVEYNDGKVGTRFINTAYSKNKEILEAHGIDTSKMEFNTIDGEKITNSANASYIIGLVKSSGVTKKLRDSIESRFREELVDGKASEYLKHEAKTVFGEKAAGKIEDMSGEDLVLNLTELFMHHVNEKQVNAAYEAFGFGADTDSGITFKNAYDNVMETTSNAPLKLLLTQFNAVDSHGGLIKRLLASVASGNKGTFDFNQKLAIINQTLEDYKEIIANFKDSPILRALPDELKDKLVDSIEYGFNKLSTRVTKFQDAYNSADSVKKEALLVASENYFKNLSKVFDITAHVTTSFVNNMTAMSKQNDGFLSDLDIGKALTMSLSTVNSLNINSIRKALYSADSVLSDNTVLGKPLRYVRHTWLSILNSGTMTSLLRNVADPYYGLSSAYTSAIKNLDNERSDLLTELATASSLVLNPNDKNSMRSLAESLKGMLVFDENSENYTSLINKYAGTKDTGTTSEKIETAKKGLIADILGVKFETASEKELIEVNNHYTFINSAAKSGVLDIILNEAIEYTTSKDFYNAQKLSKKDIDLKGLDAVWTESLEEKIKARVGEIGLREFKAAAKSSMGEHTNTADAFNLSILMHSEFVNNLMYNSIYNDKLFELLKTTSPRLYESVKQTRGVLKKVAGYGIMNGEIGAYSGKETPLEKLGMYMLENGTSAREKLAANPLQIQKVSNTIQYYATMMDETILSSFSRLIDAANPELSGKEAESVIKLFSMGGIGRDFMIGLNSDSDTTRAIVRAALFGTNTNKNTKIMHLAPSEVEETFTDKKTGEKVTKKNKDKAFVLNPVAGKNNTFSTHPSDKVFSGTPESIVTEFLRLHDIAFQIRVKGNKQQLGILRKGIMELRKNPRLNTMMLDDLEKAVNTENKKGTVNPSEVFRAVITDLKDNFQAKTENAKNLTPDQAAKAEIYDELFKTLVSLDTSNKEYEGVPVISEVSDSYILGEKISVIIVKKGTNTIETLEDAVRMSTGLEGAELKQATIAAEESLMGAVAGGIKQPPGNQGNSRHGTELYMRDVLNNAVSNSKETILDTVTGKQVPYIKLELPKPTAKDKNGIETINVINTRFTTTEESSTDYAKADLVITAVGGNGTYEIPISLKSSDFAYIDSTTTFWANTLVKTLVKGMLNHLSKVSNTGTKEDMYARNLVTDMLLNVMQADPVGLKESFTELYKSPALMRSFGALIKMTDFDPSNKTGLSPFTERGSMEAFNRALTFIANNKDVYDMYTLYKDATSKSDTKENSILKLAKLVGEDSTLENRDSIINKAKLVISSEMLANEKNSNPWMNSFSKALNDREKMTQFTELFLNRLLGIGGEKANAGKSNVDIYKNFLQLGLNSVEKEEANLKNTIADSIMNDLVSGPYGALIKLDPSFEPIMAFNKDPFTAASDVIKTMFDSIKLKQWAGTVARDSGTIRVLDYAGVYSSPADRAADKLSEENGTMVVVSLKDLAEKGVVGNELLGVIRQMPEVRSKILDLMTEHQMKTSSSQVTDPSLFIESSLNKFFNTFNVGKNLEDVKVGITKDFWEEVVHMKDLFTPKVPGTGFGAKFLDSFQQLTSYFGVNFSGVVLITNHISWLRNLFGAYLQPALSLGSGIKGIQYSNRAISAILGSRKGNSASSNKDIALYDEFLKFNPRKPLSLARQGTQPFAIPTSKLDREKHHTFRTANFIINKPMELINKGIFNAVSKVMGTDPNMLEANLRGAYGMIDDITKFAIWMAAKEGKVAAPEDWSGLSRMMSGNKSLEKSLKKVYSTDIVDTIKNNGKYLRAMSSEDAARYANKFSFLYDGLPPAWGLVKNIWNPFASFTYNSMRILHNSMKTYPAKVLATYIGFNILNQGFLKGQYGMTLDFSSFVPNMDAFSHMPFSTGRPEEFNITNPSAPFMRFFRMLMEQKDPFTGQDMENMGGLEQLARAYITSFMPVSPTLNAALRGSISLAKQGMGMNDTHIAKTGVLGTILSFMPESYIHKKMTEQGFIGRPIDKFGTTVSPLFGILYGALGLNFKLEDKAKSKLIVNQYIKTRKNLETQLKNLKQTDMMRTNKDIQYEITSLESRLKALAERTVSAFDDVFGEVPKNVKDAYIGASFNPVDYINAAWMSVLRSVYEDYGRSADYSLMRK